ncbi:MAG TPA: ABC transporter substrate-binding protein [Micromonosporaceae bacterium]|nr:ABC transporter substrate-binding protein [Micromonosporaceae bacterium]
MGVTGVDAMAGRAVDELSGGEVQRVWLATCLAQDTGVLLLDEPTTFLDLRYRVEILDLVRDLADEHGVAVGVVLHDLNQASAVADRVVLLHDGAVLASGEPGEVLTAQRLSAAYGHPDRGVHRTGHRPCHRAPGGAAPRPPPRPHRPFDERKRTVMTRRFVAAALAAGLLLAGCGTTEEPAPAAGDARAAAGPVTFTDSRGKTVTLDAPATTVVGLEWGEVEMLVSLGVQPVGVADVKGYATWNTAAKLDAGVKDVGTRTEPSVDSIAALQPDLVVMGSDAAATLAPQVEKFAPVLVTKGSDASRNLDRMREDLKLIATAVGRTAEGEKLLADLDAAVADGKKRIADAGAAGRHFAIADGWKEGSSISIRMFGQGALVSQVGIALGLRNAWDGKTDPAWGLGQTDVEGLNALKDKDLHFFYNASDGTDVFADGLDTNAIWTALPFVAQDKLHRMPDGIWTFGGPLSCQQYLDQLVKVYAP